MKKLFLSFIFLWIAVGSISQEKGELFAGWSSKSITPEKPTALAGQFETRISRKALDPVTCTALALETRSKGRLVEASLLISIDLVDLRHNFDQQIKAAIAKKLPNFDTNKILINVTHTHTGPSTVLQNFNIPKEAIQPDEYREFAAERIAEAAMEAWNNRKPGGISWGLGQAVVGYNRRVVYTEPISSVFGAGHTVMYGNANNPSFSHIEGTEDHAVELLFLWDNKKQLTGILVNIACPAQETESLSEVSADFWHEAREQLAKKFGQHVFILPQVAAAGDISPHLIWRKKAEEAMLKRKGLTRRQELGRRISQAIVEVYPYVQQDIQQEIVLRYTYKEIKLPVRRVTKSEALQAEKLAKDDPSKAFWHNEIIARYKSQEEDPQFPARINVLRIGDVVMASNPFELFLDYGIQIKARSQSLLTMLVQLASGGTPTYLPTARAEAGKGYSAIVQSNLVGHEGGQQLVEETLDLINQVLETP